MPALEPSPSSPRSPQQVLLLDLLQPQIRRRFALPVPGMPPHNGIQLARSRRIVESLVHGIGQRLFDDVLRRLAEELARPIKVGHENLR